MRAAQLESTMVALGIRLVVWYYLSDREINRVPVAPHTVITHP